MLGKTADCLPHAVLKRKLTIKPIRQRRIEPTFKPMSFRPFPITLPVAFRVFVRAPTTAPIVTPVVRNMAVTITPYFLEDLLDLSRERQRSFSFLNLSLQMCERLVSFHHSSLCGFSFRGQGVVILDDCLVFFVLALELAFSLFQFIKGLCAVQPFFYSISFSYIIVEICFFSGSLFLQFLFFLLVFQALLLLFSYHQTLFEIFFQLLQPIQSCFTFKIAAMFFLMGINPRLRSFNLLPQILHLFASCASFSLFAASVFACSSCFSASAALWRFVLRRLYIQQQVPESLKICL